MSDNMDSDLVKILINPHVIWGGVAVIAASLIITNFSELSADRVEELKLKQAEEATKKAEFEMQKAKYEAEKAKAEYEQEPQKAEADKNPQASTAPATNISVAEAFKFFQQQQRQLAA